MSAVPPMSLTMRTRVQDLVAVFKLRIGVAIALCAVAGVAATPGPRPQAWQVALIAIAVLLSAASAGAFNHYVEADLDAQMPRTRSRPFVAGRFSRGPAWLTIIGGLLVIAVGAAWAGTNAIAAFHVLMGAFIYGVVYTVWLKRRTAWNIVWGGLSGSFAVLAGAAVVDPMPTPVPLLLALVLFLWTPPHFWALATALREDYIAGGVPMLPAVVGSRRAARVILASTVALVAASLAPALFGLGVVYLIAAAAGGAAFLVGAINLVREPTPKKAMACFHTSLLQLTLVLFGAIVDGAWAP